MKDCFHDHIGINFIYMTVEQSEQLLLTEVQVLLAEKRTYFALFRTGMAVVTVPLSVLVFLLATTKFHGLFDHWLLTVAAVVGLTAISLSGFVLVSQSQRKLRKINKLLRVIESQNERIARILV